MKALTLIAALLLLTTAGFAQNIKSPSIGFPPTNGKTLKLNSFPKDPVFRLEQFRKPDQEKSYSKRSEKEGLEADQKQGLQNSPKVNMPVFKPDSTIRYHLLAVKPDSTIRFKIRNRKPE